MGRYELRNTSLAIGPPAIDRDALMLANAGIVIAIRRLERPKVAVERLR